MDIFNVNLNLYKSFYYVAKYDGFTKASNKILLSQGTLSNNIKTLEAELGTTLFVRGKNSVTLTKDGERLYSQIESIMNILSSKVEKKELNIGSLRFIADNYISDIVKKFKEKHPLVTIKFDFCDSTDLFRKLKKNELDIVLCRYPLMFSDYKNTRIEKIIDVSNCFVCSKEYYEKEHLDIVDEKHIYKLILPSSSEKRRIIEQYLIDNNIRHRVSAELPSSVLLKKLILNGTGIGYINEKFISDEVEQGNAIILDRFKNIPLDNISIIYNINIDNPLLKDFIDILKETIQKTNN